MLTHEDIEADFDSLFVQDGLFSEDIGYCEGGGDPVPMKAIVYRKGATQGRQQPKNPVQSYQMRYQIEVEISKSTAMGRSKVSPRSDQIEVALTQRGDDVQRYPIAEILPCAHGRWRVGLST